MNEWDNWKVGDRVKIDSRHPCTEFQGCTGTIIQFGGLLRVEYDECDKLIGGGSFLLGCEAGWLIKLHTWQVGDRFKVKADNGAEWHGTVASLPPAYHILDDQGRSWEWTTWESFCREAEFVGTPTRATLSCQRCHEPNSYAEPNLPGGGYACYSCRKYHGYGCK